MEGKWEQVADLASGVDAHMYICYVPCMVAFMFVRTHVCLYTCMRVHMSILILPAPHSTFYFTKSQQ